MTEDQAWVFLRDVQTLPENLGRIHTFVHGAPCCAVGHLAAKAGYVVAPAYVTSVSGYRAVYDAYGLEDDVDSGFIPFDILSDANDGADDDSRHAEVVAAAKLIVRHYGFDPDKLRGEVA